MNWMKKMLFGVAGVFVASTVVLAVSGGPLSDTEQARFDADYKVRVTHTDLTNTNQTSGQTQTIALVNVEDKVGAYLVAMVLRTPFKDASDTNNNVTAVIVGDGGDTDRFLASTELNENGTEIDLSFGTGTKNVYTATDTIDVIFDPATNATTSLEPLDTGVVDFYFRTLDGRNPK